jgi:hypothetical protein
VGSAQFGNEQRVLAAIRFAINKKRLIHFLYPSNLKLRKNLTTELHGVSRRRKRFSYQNSVSSVVFIFDSFSIERI